MRSGQAVTASERAGSRGEAEGAGPVRVPGEIRDEGVGNVTSLQGIRHIGRRSPRSVRCLYGYGEQRANGGLRRPGIPHGGARPGDVPLISLTQGRRSSRRDPPAAPSPGAFALGSAMRSFLRTHRPRQPGGATDVPRRRTHPAHFPLNSSRPGRLGGGHSLPGSPPRRPGRPDPRRRRPGSRRPSPAAGPPDFAVPAAGAPDRAARPRPRGLPPDHAGRRLASARKPSESPHAVPGAGLPNYPLGTPI